MSRIYRRKDTPHWYYQAGTGPFRIQKSTGTASRRIAGLIQNKWDEQRILQRNGIIDKRMTCHELFDEFIELIDSRKSKPWAKKMRYALSHFLRIHGTDQISSITTTSINEYITDRMADKKANKTVRDEVSIIKTMFNYGIDNSYISANPCEKAMLPAKKTIKPRKPIPPDIVKKAIKQAWREDDRIYWTVLYYTGLRAGDAGTLKPENIDGDMIRLETEKTAEPVVIPLHNDLLQYKNKMFNLMPNEGRRKRSTQRFQQILSELDYVGGDIHSLRHTFNTLLRDLGLAYEDRKALLGHSQASKVTSDYTHPNAELLRDYINKL